MIDRDLPVTEDELHAYADGELPDDRRSAVEAWLAAHPDDMARVGAWRARLMQSTIALAQLRASLSRRASTSINWRTLRGPGKVLLPPP